MNPTGLRVYRDVDVVGVVVEGHLGLEGEAGEVVVSKEGTEEVEEVEEVGEAEEAEETGTDISMTMRVRMRAIDMYWQRRTKGGCHSRSNLPLQPLL